MSLTSGDLNNDIKFINFTTLLLALPNIKTVYANDNPLNCLDVYRLICKNHWMYLLHTYANLWYIISSLYFKFLFSINLSKINSLFHYNFPFSVKGINYDLICAIDLTPIIYSYCKRLPLQIRTSSYVIIIVQCLLFLLVLLLLSLVCKYCNHRASMTLLENCIFTKLSWGWLIYASEQPMTVREFY